MAKVSPQHPQCCPGEFILHQGKGGGGREKTLTTPFWERSNPCPGFGEGWGGAVEQKRSGPGGKHSQAAQRLGLLEARWPPIPKRMRQWEQAKDWVLHPPTPLKPQKKRSSFLSSLCNHGPLLTSCLLA